MAQQGKDPALSPLWCGFHLWPGNLRILWAWPPKKKKLVFHFFFFFPVFFFFFSFLVFLGPHLWHMGVPRLGVKSELQLLAYTTATAMKGSELCL